MNLLFAMSISGSILSLLYLLIKPIAKRGFTAHWQYNFLKICLLFYLIPYQCFQDQYRKFCKFLFGYEGKAGSLDGGPLVFKAENTIYITSDGKMHYEYGLPLLICFCIWLCIIAVLLYKQIKNYSVCRKKILQIAEPYETEAGYKAGQHRTPVSSARFKRMRIIRCPLMRVPFTIGLLRPIIVLPGHYKTEDLPLYLLHELSHVKNHDILWKFTAFFTIMLHWYNPLVYLLFREVCVVCEKHCDETVMASLDEEQKIHYGDLVIEAARNHTEIDTVFVNTFSSNKKQIEERLLFMTRENSKASYWKIITAVVIFIAALAMPLSVMAYEPVKVYHDEQPYQPGDMYIYAEDMSSPFEAEAMQFVQVDFSLSDEIMTDEYGNQYPITVESKKNARSCSHEFIKGSRNHHVQSGSGCTVYIYTGIYCKNCGARLQESLDSQCTYTKCPH